MYKLFSLLLLTLACSAVPSFAQTPAGEISAGWAFRRILDESLDEFQNMPLGFHVGGAGRITRSFGFAGDLGWNRKTQTDSFDTPLERELSLTTFSLGPRFYFGDPVTVFVHFLLGGIRRTWTSSFEGQEYSGSHTGFMFQPGGGVDISVSDRVALRVQFDYQWGEWYEAEDPVGTMRFVAGGVFYLGER